MPAPKPRTWTDEQLRDAVASSTTYQAVLRALGLKDGSRRYLQDCIRKQGLDTSHFDGSSQKQLTTDDRLREVVVACRSVTEVLQRIGVELHSNNFYKLRRRIRTLGLDTTHFKRDQTSKGGRRSWTDEQLRAAVVTSHGYADTIRKLGLIPAGGNYVAVQRRIQDLALDTSHFLGAGWNVEGKYIKPIARPLEEVLVTGRRTTSHLLKKRLIRAGLMQERCELCGWAERRETDGVIPLELDHKNGDPADNRRENLRILCPNCHALQPTHRGLNKKSRKESARGGT